MAYNDDMSSSSSIDSMHSLDIDGSPDTSGYVSSTDPAHDDEYEEAHSVVFENSKPLLHALEYILCVREMCDVTFLVGQAREPVHGLRAVMGSRSRYFYDLFMSHKKKTTRRDSVQKSILSVFKRSSPPQPVMSSASKASHSRGDNLAIVVPDYDHEVFRRVVSFVHFGHVTVTSDTVMGLICASSEYQLEDLRKACWDFVDRCLTSGSLQTLLQSGFKYRKSQHIKLFLTMISNIRQ